MEKLNSSNSAFLKAAVPNPRRVSGKADPAGDDPGDLLLHQISSSSSVFDSLYSLEDKAYLKRPVRPLIGTREGCLWEKGRFELPRPPEPPLSSGLFVCCSSIRYHLSNDPTVFLWFEQCTTLANQLNSVISLEGAQLKSGTNSRKSVHSWLGGREEAASIDPGDILLAYSTGAAISSCVDIILEEQVSKMVDHGCTIQGDSDDDNLKFRLVYHSPRPPEFRTKSETCLKDRNWNKLIKGNFLQDHQEIKPQMSTEWWQEICSLKGHNSQDQGHFKMYAQADFMMFEGQITDKLYCSLKNIIELQQIVRKFQNDTMIIVNAGTYCSNANTKCTRELHGQSSYYNLEDKVVLKGVALLGKW